MVDSLKLYFDVKKKRSLRQRGEALAKRTAKRKEKRKERKKGTEDQGNINK